jgi:hypothetical protein
MINADRVKRKLPSLLVDGPTNCSKKAEKAKKKNWNNLRFYDYRLKRLQKKNPERCNFLTNKIFADLDELKDELKNELNE